MSSAAVRAPFPASGSPFSLEKPLLEPGHSRLLELPRGVVPGSRLEVRPAPATVASGIAEIDALTGGLPRGALSEIFGPASSGRTSLILAALAEATRRQEVCALVDAGDSFHPESAAAAGMDLRRLLWIRCGAYSPQRHGDTEAIDDLTIADCRLQAKKPISSPPMNADQRGSTRQSSITNRQSSGWERRLEQVLKATDLLLHSGGFGLVVVDLADVPPRFARRIPLASWFRFRRAVENTPTVLLVVEQEPYAKTCASLVLRMQQSAVGNQHSAFSAQHAAREAPNFGQEHAGVKFAAIKDGENDGPPHARLLRGLPVKAEVVHARFQRKPTQSATQFSTRTAWSDSVAG
ncbi:MAG TPA: hypothetical protein VKT29_15830 [Terriglobales bacterium]|nr:hypothetical protein [Terriglobales bacterium]